MEEQQERRNVGEEEGGQPSRNCGQTVPKHMECRIIIDEINPRLEGGQPSRNNGQTVPKHMEYRIMIDEIRPRLEGGQPNRNSGQTGPELEENIIDEISPRVKNWIESIEKAKERTQSQTQWARIPKVPEMLRGIQDFKKFYEPKVVSIGPYHHGKPNLQPGEMIKPLCAKKFLVDRKQVEALYKKIKSKIKEVKNCYDWSSTNEYDNEELAWMMLLDGCFLLQFIRSRFDSTVKVLRVHQIEFVDDDLFLLENQLPFGVLKLILDEAKLNEMIKKFVTAVACPEELRSEIQLEENDEEPSHLLDLLRSALLGKYKKGSKQKVGSQSQKKQEDKKKGDGGFCCPWKKGKQQEQEAGKKGESSLSSGGGDGGIQPEQEQEADKKGESSLSSGGGDGGIQPEQEQEADKKGESSLSSGGGDGGIQPEQEQEADKKGESSLSSGGGDGGIQPEQEQEADKKGESSLSSGGGDGGIQPEQEQEADKKGESSLSSGGGDGGIQPEQDQEADKKGESSLSSGGGDGGSQPEQEQKEMGGSVTHGKKGKQRGISQSFRHIKELKAAGIHLKPSRTSSLTDISFNSYFFYGNLKLPPITIDDSTKPKLLNIVAYEMCPDAPHDYAVTSYICFLDNLIDHAEDVKELRSKHILNNCLGSDEEVAQIFNEITDGLVNVEAYEEVKVCIQKHYDKRLNTWMAQALHDHFRSPWTIMAFIAAVLILLFTGTQTYYALPGNSK